MKRSLVISLEIFTLLFTKINLAQCQNNKAPLIPEIKNIEIVDCIFVKGYLAGTSRWSVPEKNLHKYRIAILTLRIKKNPGDAIKIAVADITLHYNHGDYGNQAEVAPCYAISTFSKSLDVDRELKGSKNPPGWIKRTTGTRTTAASTVYVDVAFVSIEQNASNMWICIGDPVTPKFSSSGW